MVTAYATIGQAVGRAEGPEKVTGAAIYPADINPPGTLVGRCLRSPYPYTRIRSIDASAAREAGYHQPKRQISPSALLRAPGPRLQVGTRSLRPEGGSWKVGRGMAISERPIRPVAPAIANAVLDAVGVSITELPVTAEKVYWALRQSSGST